MSEMNDGPSDARRTIENGENEEPREEEDENISSPYTWICEPLCVPIHIRRRKRSYVHRRHRRFVDFEIGDDDESLSKSLSLFFFSLCLGLFWAFSANFSSI